MFHTWLHHLDTLHKNSITSILRTQNIYLRKYMLDRVIHIRFELKIHFPFFLPSFFFLFPPQCDKVRKLCHFTRSNPVATQLVPHHSVYRAQFIERVATLPSPILGCIANDSSSTRKIIFDWAARALELGRLASNLPFPSPLPRG